MKGPAAGQPEEPWVDPAEPTGGPARQPSAPSRLTILFWSGVALFFLVFVLIQFIPVNHTNPPPTTRLKWDSLQTETLAGRACMDCHSDETVWPWFSFVAPASWVIYYDVLRGRSVMNFSEYDVTSLMDAENPSSGPGGLAYQLGERLAGGPFGTPTPFPLPGGIASQLTDDILNQRMPPSGYLTIRPDANLNPNERQVLLKGLLLTLGLTHP